MPKKQERFAVVPGWIFDVAELSSIEKLVFVGLCLYKNSRGCCFPSVLELGRITSLGKTSVAKALNELERVGAIKRRSRYAKEGGKTSNEFYIATAPSHEFATRTNEEVHKFATRRGVVRHAKGGSSPRDHEQYHLTKPINRGVPQKNVIHIEAENFNTGAPLENLEEFARRIMKDTEGGRNFG